MQTCIHIWMNIDFILQMKIYKITDLWKGGGIDNFFFSCDLPKRHQKPLVISFIFSYVALLRFYLVNVRELSFARIDCQLSNTPHFHFFQSWGGSPCMSKWCFSSDVFLICVIFCFQSVFSPPISNSLSRIHSITRKSIFFFFSPFDLLQRPLRTYL